MTHKSHRTARDRANAVLAVLPALGGHPITDAACDAVIDFVGGHVSTGLLTHDLIDDVCLCVVPGADPLHIDMTSNPKDGHELIARGDIEHIAAEIFRLSERLDAEPETRQVKHFYQKPAFLGEVADRAREHVLRTCVSRDTRRTLPAIRRATAEAVQGRLVQIVLVGNRRAIHTGPFPLEGFNIVENAIVADACAETGAVTTVRPVILPVLTGRRSRLQAAIFSFWAGVMPPIPMLGRSLL